MSVELDIGPLSWVKGEIDLALERAGESLKAYGADTSGDGLSKARAGMHQAHGALAIVGLEGITEFANAIEQLLAALGDGAAKDLDPGALCSGGALPPPLPLGRDGRVDLTASFCDGQAPLSSVQGWVARIEGIGDKRFRQLLGQMARDLVGSPT